MKLYLSIDMEGLAGVSAATEVNMAEAREYAPFQRQMTEEASAACRGAWAAGVDEVVIKDAHWTGRNLDLHALSTAPGKTMRLIRGWSGHPFAMVQDIDESFSALAFVGYHSASGCDGNPLAHTVSGKRFERLEVNDELVSEFHLYAWAAASVGVPLVFLSGDGALCEVAQHAINGLITVPTLQGVGASTISMAPAEAIWRIETGIRDALLGPHPAPISVPASFEARLTFHQAQDAYAKAFFPGARQISSHCVAFDTNDLMALLTFIWFVAQ